MEQFVFFLYSNALMKTVKYEPKSLEPILTRTTSVEESAEGD